MPFALQAKLVLEEQQREKRGGALRPGAQGALRRLLRGVGGNLMRNSRGDAKREKKDQMRKLDRRLAKENKANKKRIKNTKAKTDDGD